MSVLPRSISGPTLSLDPPVPDDVALVAELMGVPATEERPAQIVTTWREHWDTHGFGPWIVRDRHGERVGFVGLRATSDFIRLTLRLVEDEGGNDLAAAALRLVGAHAMEFLPDLPVRIRIAPEDDTLRSVVESAGLEHVGDLDHVVEGDDWQVLELPYIRIADRVPARARAAMLRMWVGVTDAGGSVGFLPGATAEDVEPVLDGYIARIEQGDTVCVALNSPHGELLGFGFVVGSTSALNAHTATLERVMTDPERRGTNFGALLMAGLHRAARERGAEIVTLDYRGGTGLGEFYTRYGYSEVGRVPGAIRVAPGDDRDGVIMARSL
ncbi:MAG: GNAT family N-acetyltransferase [Janibacter sp.]